MNTGIYFPAQKYFGE